MTKAIVTTKAKARATKTNIVIGEFKMIDKEMPKHSGKGGKYNFLEMMNVGDCICLPTGSSNVPVHILKRAISGAAKRRGFKVICAVEAEGFLVWRKT